NAGTGYTSAPAIVFSAGTVATAGTIPTGTGNASNFIVSGIQVTNPGSGFTTAPAVTFSSGTATAATANLSAVVLGAATTIGGSGDIVINPGITGGSNALTKIGTGTLVLNGANTFAGATTVSAGALVIAGTHTSSVTVGNGGTLAHPGSITGSVTIQSGGLDAPTASPALRNIAGNFALNSGGTLRLLLNGSAVGTQYDQVAISGSITLGGALDILAAPTLAPGNTFTILNKAGSATTGTTFTGKAENSTFVTTDGYTFRINYNAGTGNDIVLTLVTTPIEQWRFANFGSILNTGFGLDTADSEGDGVSNLMEYATRMNPALHDTVPISVVKNGSSLDFTYNKNKAATDVTFVVEWSDTLNGTDWSVVGVGAPVILADDGVTQQMKVTVPAGSGVTRRFVRLKVTR
ncbi:MAG: autotransporter-associated beta strand repeat-containing protein, partial [Chthoniobacteraceae bacterium]